MNKLWALVGRVCYWVSWPVSHFYLKNSQRTRVVVRAEDQVLFVKDWLGNGCWKIPGGGVRKAESIATAASRELREETGIQAKSTDLKPAGSIKSSDRNPSVELHIYVLTLPTTVKISKQKLEIVDIGWFKAEDLLKNRRLSKNTKAIFEKIGGFELNS